MHSSVKQQHAPLPLPYWTVWTAKAAHDPVRRFKNTLNLNKSAAESVRISSFLVASCELKVVYRVNV
jgi:hypothetical protein